MSELRAVDDIDRIVAVLAELGIKPLQLETWDQAMWGMACELAKVDHLPNTAERCCVSIRLAACGPHRPCLFCGEPVMFKTGTGIVHVASGEWKAGEGESLHGALPDYGDLR